MTNQRPPRTRRRNRRFLGLLPPPGSAPGQLRQVPDAEETAVSLSLFSQEKLEEVAGADVSTLNERWNDQKKKSGMTWVDVIGLKDTSVLQRVAEAFQLPALAMEDVTSTHQRSKVDAYDSVTFVVVRLPWEEDDEIRYEQVSLFIGNSFVVSFQETQPDVFDEVRSRLRKTGTKVRRLGADFFGYALMDCVVDHYMPIMNKIEDRIDALEDDVFAQAAGNVMPQLLLTRRTLAYLRRAAKPLQGSLSTLLDEETSIFTAETRLYLRDTLDHIDRVLDNIESDREVCASLMDVHLSVSSQRLNEVMKVLTIISVTFIPLSFIAGLYGMNFDTKHPTNMPELGWSHGYWFALGLMATSTLLFLGYFWRKGWLTKDDVK